MGGRGAGEWGGRRWREEGRGTTPSIPLSSLIDFHVRPSCVVSHLPTQTQKLRAPDLSHPCRFSRSPFRLHSLCLSFFDHLIPILSTSQMRRFMFGLEMVCRILCSMNFPCGQATSQQVQFLPLWHAMAQHILLLFPRPVSNFFPR